MLTGRPESGFYAITDSVIASLAHTFAGKGTFNVIYAVTEFWAGHTSLRALFTVKVSRAGATPRWRTAGLSANALLSPDEQLLGDSSQLLP